MSDGKLGMTNTIRYDGSLKVVLTNKDGKIKQISYHNSGKLPLFTSICRALAGYDIEYYKPAYLMCYRDDAPAGSENPKYVKVLAAKIPYSTTPTLYQSQTSGQTTIYTKNDRQCDTIEYVFTLPITAIATTIEDNQTKIKVNKFALQNKNGEDCAEILLDDVSNPALVITNAVDKSNILIYWKLHFSNKGE